MRFDLRLVVICGAMAVLGGAAVPMLAGGQGTPRPAGSAAPRAGQPPPFITPRACPKHALRLGSDAVALAALAALRAEQASDRPKLLAAVLADHDGPRNAMVRQTCGRRVWHRTVGVSIDLRAYHPSASLSERVSFVARTRAGYLVYAIGH